MLKVVCVLRSGGEYDAEYVERLRDGIARHLPLEHRFLCLSDVPVGVEDIPLKHDWPGWWSKLEVFRPDIFGDILFFDLDTVITGDLSDISRVGQLTMLSDFHDLENIASGVMYLPWSEREAIWREWIADPSGHMTRNRGHGDGGFLRKFWNRRASRWQDLLPGQIVSYKAHVRKAVHPIENGDGSLPADARVVCFHGRPRPREVGWKVSTEVFAASAS